MISQPFIRAAAISVMLGSLSLSACAHTGPATVTSCIPLRDYSDAEKQMLKDAYDQAAPGSAIRLVVDDLYKTREEVRAACKP